MTYKEQCIFVDTPPYCEVCLASRKLQCLQDHQHLILSEEGKQEIRRLLESVMASPERYKTKSGEEQRPH